MVALALLALAAGRLFAPAPYVPVENHWSASRATPFVHAHVPTKGTEASWDKTGLNLAAIVLFAIAAVGLGVSQKLAKPAPLMKKPRQLRPRFRQVSMNADDSCGDSCWSSEDEDRLRESIRRSHARKGEPHSVLGELKSVHVLIFNAGTTNEGVYTLCSSAGPDQYVLAFETTDDASSFADMLEAEGFELATPLNWDREQIFSFCHGGNFEVSLVPSGAVITPPSQNTYDHDAFQRLDLEKQVHLPDAHPAEEFKTFSSERAMFERMFTEDESGP
jgi:hypothetical protein